MSQFDSSESEPPDSSPISSGEIETPRGGFMARPGLKAPPRHAVVVRVGDAPRSEDIPVARSSFPPPPPSVPPPESQSEKVTLRAIPTPRSPNVAALAPTADDTAASLAVAASAAVQPTRLMPPVVFESAPPPSDAPVVANVEERLTPLPRSRRAARSHLTILAAALAGLILGIVSVVTTVHVRDAGTSAGVAAAPLEGTPLPVVSEPPRAVRKSAANVAPAPSAAAERETAEGAPTTATPQAPGRPGAAKRSIF